jgi:putative selenate reductase
MAEIMQPIEFKNLLDWIHQEYKHDNSIFGIHSSNFFGKANESGYMIFSDSLETPLGPAAGPHTQLTQNIISSYLTGGRFFELKTVQVMDELKIDKPCIDAEDEGYNIEWSQELKLSQSFDEYLKAWFLLHVLKNQLNLSSSLQRGFIFNMSVGYNLEGIKSNGMNEFISNMIDAGSHKLFQRYIQELQEHIYFKQYSDNITNISPKISNSVTLSTMHGCPPEEIESIAKYLIKEKNLHTYVKMNPTLLGFDTVQEIMNECGYKYILLDKTSFEHDMQYCDAVPMLKRMKEFAKKHNREFGVKLSNTLGVKNNKQLLQGTDMYMSGRTLFPLTIHLAYKLANEFNGDLYISYSGGASVNNVEQILGCNIYPITFATELLKPGGYLRLKQISQSLEGSDYKFDSTVHKINLESLQTLARESLKKSTYKKEKRAINSIKNKTLLPKFNCYVSPCSIACPIHQDVSEYIHLVEEEKYSEALEVIYSKNPLPYITGYICDHQCQYHCTRWDYDEPVKIREMKKTAVEKGLDEYIKKIFSKTINNNFIKAAVIGAGPSGLAASYFLRVNGFDVTIFEKNDCAGGVVQNIIPDFRLPQLSIDKDIEFIKSLGVQFKFNNSENFSIEELKNAGYKYIYISIGAGKSSNLYLEGDNTNIINSIEFLWRYHHKDKINLGKSTAVIGGGNSAMDAARTAIRIPGMEKVYIIYRRTKEFMPADREEFDNAISDGVVFKELLLPIEFYNKNLKCQKMMLGELGEDGRRKVIPMENEFEEINVDFIISAIGEQVDINILQSNDIRIDKSGKPAVNPFTNETNLENVFIGGDALKGPSTVVEAIADGKKAAEIILAREKIQPNHDVRLNDKLNGLRIEKVLTQKGIVIFQHEKVQEEASGCLACNLICNKCVEVCPNRANIAIKIETMKDKYQILHIDRMCNNCGNCETFCPHQGAPYKDKVTLFWSEEDFNESMNDGFYLQSAFTYLVRYNSSIGKIVFNKDWMIDSKSLNMQDEKDIEFLEDLIRQVSSSYPYLLKCN